MMQTLREEAATHTIKIYQERIGIIESILANSYNTGITRMHNWDALCCWEHSSFGIQSPSLSQIADCAFGTVRISDKQTKLETDERIMRQQVQRLLSCRVD